MRPFSTNASLEKIETETIFIGPVFTTVFWAWALGSVPTKAQSPKNLGSTELYSLWRFCNRLVGALDLLLKTRKKPKWGLVSFAAGLSPEFRQAANGVLAAVVAAAAGGGAAALIDGLSLFFAFARKFFEKIVKIKFLKISVLFPS